MDQPYLPAVCLFNARWPAWCDG